MRVPPLEPNVIDIWRVRISERSVATLLPLLSDDERVRAERFVFERDRAQFVATRGTLRQLLGAYVSCAPEAVQFEYTVYGKPTLANSVNLDLHFNVSHSGDLALLAFTHGRDLGIDVEQIDDRIDLHGLAQANFSREEQIAFNASADATRAESFFRYWVSKEAYVKAVGGGLSIALDAFTVHVHEAEAISRVVTTHTVSDVFGLRRVDVPAGYAAAVVAREMNWQIRIFEIGGTPDCRITAI